MAVRSTCKLFSYLRAPCAALFHDIIPWTSTRSLWNLSVLSSNGFLRHHVHRVVFVQPMLAGSSSGDPRKSWYSPEDNSFFEPSFNLWDAFKAQERMLNDKGYSTIVGKYLSKLPNLESVHISAENGWEREADEPYCCGIHDSRHDDSGWLATRHPEFIIDPDYHREYEGANYRDEWLQFSDDIQSYNRFVAQVLEILDTAVVQPRELAFVHCHGIDPDYAWDDLFSTSDLLCLEQRKVLHLSLRFGKNAFPLDEYAELVMMWKDRIKGLEEFHFQQHRCQKDEIPNDHEHFEYLFYSELPLLKVF